MKNIEIEVEQLFQSGADKLDKILYQDAIEDFLSALSLNPNHIASLYQISYSLCGLSRFEEALIYSTKIIELSPDWNSYMNRANFKKALGDIIGEEDDRNKAWAIGKIACWG